jgi:hypothetical protein
MQPLQQAVAVSGDAADLHAPVPTLLLELQTLVGSMTASVNRATDRGRRPFRPPPEWASLLGDLAYGVYLLADQSGVDVDSAVRRTAANLHQQGAQARAADAQGWPFEAH